ncbi:MAG: IS30 family transposase [Betaproteobacteria bacterium]|nr:MAG: IS30 family transposase [Betaproteobacteria bacterium]
MARGFSRAERLALWRAWKSGSTLSQIAKELNRRASSVLWVLRRDGGFEPRTRRRAERVLQAKEREEISRGLSAGLSIREIARGLGRAASTVSREIRRNGGKQLYRAANADARAWRTARRPQRCLLARRARLRAWVARHLGRNWSPRQIAVGLRNSFPHDASMRVSHETIYRSLFIQARNVLKKELVKHLRRGGFMRRPRTHPGQPSVIDGISIHQRPAEAEDRAVPGHWEGDLLMGGIDSQIATLVERHSRYVMLVRVDSKDSVKVAKALAKKIRDLPAELRRSLTWDRGSEMAAHKQFTIATDMQVYFCDPRSPWQRGSNENTNGLLRQYFPKGMDLSKLSQARLNYVARELNERPRETLNWRTPSEALKATVASTG